MYHYTERLFDKEGLMNTDAFTFDEHFRQAARRSFLSEADAARLLRIKTSYDIWKFRRVDQRALMLDYLALSVGVENRKNAEAARWERHSKLVLDFLSKLRFW